MKLNINQKFNIFTSELKCPYCKFTCRTQKAMDAHIKLIH